MDPFPWYALRVRPRCEKMVASTLLTKGYEGFLPLYRHRSRWLDINHRLPILVTPGVIQVVGIAKTPYPVDEAEISALQSIVLSSLQVEPRSYLNIGTRVRIELGPLSGVEGILTGKKGKRKLVVSVSLLQRSVEVEIDEGWVVLASPNIPALPEDLRKPDLSLQRKVV
jgi:hypothetical protein